MKTTLGSSWFMSLLFVDVLILMLYIINFDFCTDTVIHYTLQNN